VFAESILLPVCYLAFYLRVSQLITRRHAATGGTSASSYDLRWVSSGEHPFSLLLMGMPPEKMVEFS